MISASAGSATVRWANAESRPSLPATRQSSIRRPAPLAEFAFAFLDCEFGGLDPELHDITEVGVVRPPFMEGLRDSCLPAR